MTVSKPVVYEYMDIFIIEGLFTPFSKLYEVHKGLRKNKSVFIYIFNIVCNVPTAPCEIGHVPFSITNNKNDHRNNQGCSGV